MRSSASQRPTAYSTTCGRLFASRAKALRIALFPIGTKVKMRLLHNFHIRDGMIAKEIGYEIWRRDE